MVLDRAAIPFCYPTPISVAPSSAPPAPKAATPRPQDATSGLPTAIQRTQPGSQVRDKFSSQSQSFSAPQANNRQSSVSQNGSNGRQATSVSGNHQAARTSSLLPAATIPKLESDTITVATPTLPNVHISPYAVAQQLPKSSQEVVVEIPRTLTVAERAEYVVYDGLAVKKVAAPTGAESDRHLTSGNLDHREKGHAAVSRLLNLVGEILEAEDQLQPDTSGIVSANAARFFSVDDSTEVETPVLQANVQVQLDSALQKVITYGRLSSIDIEQLGRVQKLCEHATAAASSVSYRINDDIAEDPHEWLGSIAAGEQGLIASKTLLRIMTAGREEKQLYSEDTLRSLMDNLSHVVETCIIPIVEMRSCGDTADTFKIAASKQKVLIPILTACTRVLKLLGDLVYKTDVDESAITTAEYICKTLVFVENATSEKDSALGVQRFEVVRRTAMDVLAKVFARYPEQRQFIFDEILTSLVKLPVGRQSARQFKMADAKPIQLVSALLMRLIQTSASRSQAQRQKSLDKPGTLNANKSADAVEDSDEDADAESDSDAEVSRQPSKPKTNLEGRDLDLRALASPLYDAAYKDVYYVINYLLQRAMTSTKSGDQPYRNLLDIFTEDFLGVLGSTDWPAAEMLLRVLLLKLFEITEDGSKSSAPAKAMALELMGTMASRITELRLHAQSAARSIGSDASEITPRLLALHESILTDDVSEPDLLAFDGPYRIVLEYLISRDVDDAQMQTAHGYHLTQWAKLVLISEQSSAKSQEMEKRLCHMINDFQWLESEFDFPDVSADHGRFAFVLLSLHLPFCRAFNRIFGKLLNAMGGDQASLRSKSLKSIEQLLEMDPSILDRSAFVLNHILRCLQDTSTQVRDSALGLVATCLTLRPRLEGEVYERIIDRGKDPNVHVRKRVVKMLKDIYLRNDVIAIKARIADALVGRIVDTDETVVEMTRHTFEEIWMTPFHTSSDSDSIPLKAKLQLREQTSLIINIVQRKSDRIESVLADLLQVVLSEKSKSRLANVSVCRRMVKAMFEAIIEPSELPNSPPQQASLQTLTIFAAADPKLFTADQLQTLYPYIKNLSNIDNLLVYRCAIVIFRHTLPHVENLSKEFLQSVQSALMETFAVLPKAEIKEVAACLWMLDGELKNTQRLVTVARSVLVKLKQSRSGDMNANPKLANQVRKLLTIAGPFNKSFDLDAHAGAFREQLPDWKGSDVASLAVDLICPFTSPKQPAMLREAALESLCMIIQTRPKQLMRTDVCNAVELVFNSGGPQLTTILINGLKEFFYSGDKPSDANPAIKIGTGVAAGEERLGKTYVATDRDGAATSIAQRFLKQILVVALASADELALNAAQVVASINRQGLVHPKESGPCFVALETCPDNRIANVAFQEHHTLYHKHESMFEKEHMRSIQQAFDYQHGVIHSTLGYSGSPPIAKLHLFWEVLKTGSAKVRKKFLGNICTLLSFEMAKLKVSDESPKHVDLTRFCTENLAFFDYNKLDELQHLIVCLEKVMANVEAPAPIVMNGVGMGDTGQDVGQPLIPQHHAIDPARLRRLTVCAQTLFLLWEVRTYLRRLWSLSRQASAKGKGGGNAKDVARAPQRIPNSTKLTADYVARNAEIIAALGTPDSQRSLCASFAELMAIDSELKVPDEGDDAAAQDGGYETPSEGGSVRSGSVPGSAQQVRGRKRKSVGESAMNTPRKKGKTQSASVGRDVDWD
ncbi:hypothetical protein MBLNU459_g1926t1 [Dothideomycetes sp. NU459]